MICKVFKFWRIEGFRITSNVNCEVYKKIRINILLVILTCWLIIMVTAMPLFEL